jgi:hypothetical protein
MKQSSDDQRCSDRPNPVKPSLKRLKQLESGQPDIAGNGFFTNKTSRRLFRIAGFRLVLKGDILPC